MSFHQDCFSQRQQSGKRASTWTTRGEQQQDWIHSVMTSVKYHQRRQQEQQDKYQHQEQQQEGEINSMEFKSGSSLSTFMPLVVPRQTTTKQWTQKSGQEWDHKRTEMKFKWETDVTTTCVNSIRLNNKTERRGDRGIHQKQLTERLTTTFSTA